MAWFGHISAIRHVQQRRESHAEAHGEEGTCRQLRVPWAPWIDNFSTSHPTKTACCAIRIKHIDIEHKHTNIIQPHFSESFDWPISESRHLSSVPFPWRFCFRMGWATWAPWAGIPLLALSPTHRRSGGVIPDGVFLGHGEATYRTKEAWDDCIATAIFSGWWIGQNRMISSIGRPVRQFLEVEWIIRQM